VLVDIACSDADYLADSADTNDDDINLSQQDPSLD
jgi:hypothetical protein